MRRSLAAALLALLLPALAAAQEQPPRPAAPARPQSPPPPPQQQGPRSLLDRRAPPPPPAVTAPQAAPAVPRQQQQPAAAVVPPLPPAARQQQPRPAPVPAALPVVPPPPAQYPGQVPGEPPKAPPRVGDHLHETRWRVETIQGRATGKGAEQPTLEFLRDDQIRGGTGCNRFVGPWSTRASRAVMGPLRKSRLTCRPDLAQQEQQLLDTLEHTERFEFQDEGRVLLVYSSLSKAPSRFSRLP